MQPAEIREGSAMSQPGNEIEMLELRWLLSHVIEVQGLHLPQIDGPE